MTDSESTQNKPTKQNLIAKAKNFWEDIWDIEKEFNRITKMVVNIIRIIIASTQKFLQDDGLSRASAIAYTSVISLIPMLTVGFSLFSAYGGLGTKKEEIIRLAEQYVKEHNLNIDISPFTNVIVSLTDNAAGIGGVGLLVLIFSATAVLRTLEKTFNTIWRVKIQRSMLMKVIYYWAALTLGPLLLTVGGSLAGILTNMFTMPSIQDSLPMGQKVWLAGNRGLIIQTDPSFKKRAQVKAMHIDLENQIIYSIDRENAAGMLKRVPEKNKNLARIDKSLIKKANFTSITQTSKHLWVGSREGILLFSHNKGKNWRVLRFGNMDFADTFDGLEIRDIHFKDAQTGFLISTKGRILQTQDAGKSWRIIPPDIKNPLLTLEHFNLNTIHFFQNHGYILGTKGAFIHSSDGGQSWQFRQLAPAKVQGKYLNLHSIDRSGHDETWIVGQNGLILYRATNNSSWQKRSRGDDRYNEILALSKGEAVIAGENGYIMHTADGGERWHKERNSSWDFNNLTPWNNKIYAFGANLSVYASSQNPNGEQLQWEKIIGGKNFWYSLINFLAPFGVIWILFIVAYITLPNTKVPYKPAMIGASVTSAVWVIFILSFMFYIRNLSGGAQAIYGALAIIPIFLLMIYASAMILIYGAELTFTLQHPSSYQRQISFKKKRMEDIYLFDAVNILFVIFKNFETGKGPTNDKSVRQNTFSSPEAINQLINLYKENGYIEELSDSHEYLPAKSPKIINLEEIISVSMQFSFAMPRSSKSAFVQALGQKFKDIESYRSQVLRQTSFEDLLNLELKQRQDKSYPQQSIAGTGDKEEDTKEKAIEQWDLDENHTEEDKE